MVPGLECGQALFRRLHRRTDLDYGLRTGSHEIDVVRDERAPRDRAEAEPLKASLYELNEAVKRRCR